jgi:hypothetical protein
MTVSLRSMRNAAAGAVGAGALAGAMLFGGVPLAQAAPAPATSFETAGPHGGAPLGPGVIPLRPGGGGGGHGGGGGGGHGGWDHGGGWDRGGWDRGGGWDHPGWGHGGWGPPGRGFWGPGQWWNWWW